MNKDEILAKSRKENQNKDAYEKEVMRDAGRIGAITSALLGTIFFILQIVSGGGINYGLYAIVFSVSCAQFVYKAIKLKRKHEITLAIAYCVITLMFCSAHIYNLFQV